jgi:hypothetical protein
MSKNTAVFGIYKNRVDAVRGVDSLLAAGFHNDDVSILAADVNTTRDLATEKHTKAPEGATTGAVTGVLAGGTFGLLAGLGMLAIPGIGPLIAAGPIMAALAGAGAGAATFGLVGALVGMGIPEYEAKRYEGHVKDGGILVSVHAENSDWTERAEHILKGSGAHDIASTGESSSGVTAAAANH